MNSYFNITGCCNPQEHYMVNLDSRLAQIKKMVDKGQYFSINKGRQYGKTVVISMDFQFISTSEFATENRFVKAFARLLWSRCFCVSVFNPRPCIRGDARNTVPFW